MTGIGSMIDAITYDIHQRFKHITTESLFAEVRGAFATQSSVKAISLQKRGLIFHRNLGILLFQDQNVIYSRPRANLTVYEYDDPDSFELLYNAIDREYSLGCLRFMWVFFTEVLWRI